MVIDLHARQIQLDAQLFYISIPFQSQQTWSWFLLLEDLPQ